MKTNGAITPVEQSAQPVEHSRRHHWVKGQSGNPAGRRAEASPVIRELARVHTVEAIETLLLVMRCGKASERAAAANAILDRGWGRPTQPLEGSDGGPIVVKVTLFTEVAINNEILEHNG